jgi:hypothetical protein
MAAVPKNVRPSLAVLLPCDAHSTQALKAGDTIAAGDACYVAADGTVKRSTGAAADVAAKVDGFALEGDYVAGDAITLKFNVPAYYGPTTLAPGARLFLSGTTPGGLDTVASTGGTGAIAKVMYINAGRDSSPSAVLFLMPSTY